MASAKLPQLLQLVVHITPISCACTSQDSPLKAQTALLMKCFPMHEPSKMIHIVAWFPYMRTKSDASVIQQVEADVGSPPLQLPLPLLCSEGLLRMPLCQMAPAGHEALRHVPHKLRIGLAHVRTQSASTISPAAATASAAQSVAPVHASVPGGASWAGNRKPQPSQIVQQTGSCQQLMVDLMLCVMIGECADARAELTLCNRMKSSS